MSRPHAMMPEPAPLEMPVQRFDGPPPPHNAPEPRPGINLSPDDILTRRLLLVLLTGLFCIIFWLLKSIRSGGARTDTGTPERV